MSLAAYVRSPSSAQAIYEEKKVTAKDVMNAAGTQREELMAIIARRKNRRSPLKERNDHIARLSKSGMRTQQEVSKLSLIVGGKIKTDQYLDKSTLKKMISKKCDVMYPTKQKQRKKVTLLIEDAETQQLKQLEEEYINEKTLDGSFSPKRQESEQQAKL